MTHLPGLDTCSWVTALAVTRRLFPGLEPAGLQRRMTPWVLQAPKPQARPGSSQWGWRAAYLLPKNSFTSYFSVVYALYNIHLCLDQLWIMPLSLILDLGMSLLLYIASILFHPSGAGLSSQTPLTYMRRPAHTASSPSR